jgi:hypothetical protein
METKAKPQMEHETGKTAEDKNKKSSSPQIPHDTMHC